MWKSQEGAFNPPLGDSELDFKASVVDCLHAKEERECQEKGECTDLSERAMACHRSSRGIGYPISGRNPGWN